MDLFSSERIEDKNCRIGKKSGNFVLLENDLFESTRVGQKDVLELPFGTSLGDRMELNFGHILIVFFISRSDGQNQSSVVKVDHNRRNSLCVIRVGNGTHSGLGSVEQSEGKVLLGYDEEIVLWVPV